MTGEALEAEATSVGDDTRDIAIEARTEASAAKLAAASADAAAQTAAAAAASAAAGAQTAHVRLDTINGQIRRLGESHEAMRDDFNRALYGVGEDDGGLVGAVLEVKTTLSHAFKIAGVLVTAVLTVSTGITVYALEHGTSSPQPAPTRKAAVHPHHQVSRRQRALSGQLVAVQAQHP